MPNEEGRASWSVGELLVRVRREGRVAVEQDLGAFVLVAHVDVGGTLAKWSFATVAIDSSAMSLPPLPEDRERALVYPVRKRTVRFPHTILLGRASSNDVCIDSTSISKLHARVRVKENSLLIEDAGSRNGTFVDGERVVETAEVHPGDLVRFGSCDFRVQSRTEFVDELQWMLKRS